MTEQPQKATTADTVKDIQKALADGARMILEREYVSIYIPNADALAAWSTRPSASREIAVKPLKWVKDPKNVSFVDAEYVDTFGLYCIAERVLFIGHTETGIPFDTVKEAKAAAQADYERRILSAIDNPGNTDPMLIAKYDDELRKVQGRVQPDWEGFGRAITEDWPTGDIDGSDLFHMSLKYGLIAEIPGGYNPDEHIDSEGICPGRGDPWYEYTFRSAPTEHPTEQPSVRDVLSKAANDAIQGYAERTDRYASGVRNGIFTMRKAILRSLAQEGE